MFARRGIQVINSGRLLLSTSAAAARHLCMHGVHCKRCAGGLFSIVARRAMATKPARQEKEYDIARLGKYLEQELEHHKQLIKEEELTIDRVIEDYGKLIRENNISIEAGEEGEVKMVIAKEGNPTYVLRFDPAQVADAINAVPEEDAMDAEEDAALENEAAEAADFEDEGQMPFTVTIECHRSGLEKYLAMEAEVNASFEEEGTYDVYITDMVLESESAAPGKGATSYAGPTFDTLDDELREQFDQLVNKNFRKYMPLIADYARAKEAQLYAQWLVDLKTISQGAN